MVVTNCRFLSDGCHKAQFFGRRVNGRYAPDPSQEEDPEGAFACRWQRLWRRATDKSPSARSGKPHSFQSTLPEHVRPAVNRPARLQVILKGMDTPSTAIDNRLTRGDSLRGANVAKRAARKITKSSRKVSKRATKAIKKHSKKKASAKKIAQQYNAQTSATTEREARAEERLRELTAWYVLQGMNEATARQRARDEMRDDPITD